MFLNAGPRACGQHAVNFLDECIACVALGYARGGPFVAFCMNRFTSTHRGWLGMASFPSRYRCNSDPLLTLPRSSSRMFPLTTRPCFVLVPSTTQIYSDIDCTATYSNPPPTRNCSSSSLRLLPSFASSRVDVAFRTLPFA